LLVVGDGVLTLNATANFDPNIPDGEYGNRGLIEYDIVKENVQTIDSLYSRVFGSNVDGPTYINVTYSDTTAQPTITDTYSKSCYRSNDEIEVTYILENPRTTPLEALFADINFNAEFSYVTGSIQFEWLAGSGTDPVLIIDPNEPGQLTLAGNASSSTGFNMPDGAKLQIKFKVKAPTIASGGTGDDLMIESSVHSDMDEDCFPSLITDVTIPFCTASDVIITNKNVTTIINK